MSLKPAAAPALHIAALLEADTAAGSHERYMRSRMTIRRDSESPMRPLEHIAEDRS